MAGGDAGRVPLGQSGGAAGRVRSCGGAGAMGALQSSWGPREASGQSLQGGRRGTTQATGTALQKRGFSSMSSRWWGRQASRRALTTPDAPRDEVAGRAGGLAADRRRNPGGEQARRVAAGLLRKVYEEAGDALDEARETLIFSRRDDACASGGGPESGGGAAVLAAAAARTLPSWRESRSPDGKGVRARPLRLIFEGLDEAALAPRRAPGLGGLSWDALRVLDQRGRFRAGFPGEARWFDGQDANGEITMAGSGGRGGGATTRIRKRVLVRYSVFDRRGPDTFHQEPHAAARKLHPEFGACASS